MSAILKQSMNRETIKHQSTLDRPFYVATAERSAMGEEDTGYVITSHSPSNLENLATPMNIGNR